MVFNFYILFEACLSKNIFELYVYVWMNVAEFLISLQLLLFDAFKTRNNSLTLVILYSSMCLVFLIGAIYSYAVLRKFYASATLKNFGSNTDVFNAYRYKNQLFVLGKVLILHGVAGIFSAFIDSEIRIRARRTIGLIRLALLFLEIITIYLKPFDDIKLLKYVNLGTLTVDSCVYITTIAVAPTEYLTASEFRYTIFVLQVTGLILNGFILYVSYKDYTLFGSDLKNVLKKQNKQSFLATL